MIQVLFLTISVLGLLAALGTVLARNLVHAALYLVAFFFIVACQFVLLEAEFLAAIQVLIYIGAVAILMMFGIMLTRNVQGDVTTSLPKGWTWPAVGAGIALFAVLVFGINNHVGLKGRSDWSASARRPTLNSPVNVDEKSPARSTVVNEMGPAVGVQMLTRYALSFEVAGLLLTAALVGAIAIAHRETTDADPNSSAGQEAARSPERPHDAQASLATSLND
ncbi:MAG: NADH-quinone oxidoreductase subunit J [Isosphaeraceae bacterium]